MFQPWRTEDFLPTVEKEPKSNDFWEPCSSPPQSIAEDQKSQLQVNDFWESTQAPRQPSTVPAKAETLGGDFWDSGFVFAAAAAGLVQDWSADIALPLFDAHASENPFRLEGVLTDGEGIARRRGRWLASLLDLPTFEVRFWFAGKFEELFDEFQSHNTFRALSELAVEGASGDEILTAYQLRKVWADHPVFWSIRRKGYRRAIIPDNGERQLGWTKSIRLVNLSKGLPAERIIDEDWYEEWLRVPYGDPLFWSFLDYAIARLESFAQGILAIPETLTRVEGLTLDELNWRTVSIDGMKVGSFSRTGMLVRLASDALSSAHRKTAASQESQRHAEAAE
jgi:hypothetical protein